MNGIKNQQNNNLFTPGGEVPLFSYESLILWSILLTYRVQF